MKARQRSSTLPAEAGGFWPVSFSRTIMRHGFADRRVFLPLDAGEIRLGVFLLGHRAQVGGDAFHAQRADRFHARLLDGVEDRARVGALRRHRRVHLLVVAGEPQRHGVAEAARHRELMRRRPLGKLRQADPLAGHARALVGEGHLDARRRRRSRARSRSAPGATARRRRARRALLSNCHRELP